MRNSKLLYELSANPEWVIYLQTIRAQRPYVPVWSPQKSSDDWVFYSGLQAGFDLVMAHFETDAEPK